jgi:hypothetical protein
MPGRGASNSCRELVGTRSRWSCHAAIATQTLHACASSCACLAWFCRLARFFLVSPPTLRPASCQRFTRSRAGPIGSHWAGPAEFGVPGQVFSGSRAARFAYAALSACGADLVLVARRAAHLMLAFRPRLCLARGASRLSERGPARGGLGRGGPPHLRGWVHARGGRGGRPGGSGGVSWGGSGCRACRARLCWVCSRFAARPRGRASGRRAPGARPWCLAWSLAGRRRAQLVLCR